MARLVTLLGLLMAATPDPCSAACFLQTRSDFWPAGHKQTDVRAVSQRQACAALKSNAGVFYTVDIEVGTPGQTFSVVADTGSNTLIVPSCACPEFGFCASSDRCFLGLNHSASYKLIQGWSGAQSMSITFGSGQIDGYLAQEAVRIGRQKANMSGGLLLMTINKLNLKGSFEGILGLGIPRERQAKSGHAGAAGGAQSMGERIKEIMKRIAQARARAAAGQIEAPAAPRMDEAGQESGQLAAPGGFLEQANISRFSMCFNDEGADGVLRIGGGPLRQAHGSVSNMHWSVDLRGISVGSASVPLKLGSQGNLTAGRPTGVGAIPDSGTTFIMVPPSHVSGLLEGLCDAWPRCNKNFTALTRAAAAARQAATKYYKSDPFHIEVTNRSKSRILLSLLKDCESWLAGGGSGLDELPPLKFHIAGSSGTEQNLTLPGSAYIVQKDVPEGETLETFETDREGETLETFETDRAGNKTGRALNKTALGSRMVCRPAMAAMRGLVGDTWILGQPLFYEYSVGYDLSTAPPSVSFTSTREVPCGSCDRAAGLVAQGAGPARTGRPRALGGEPRLPSFDVAEAF